MTVNAAVIAAHAAAWAGTPFRRRAALRGVGADCVGLVRGILAEVSDVAVTPPPFVADWPASPESLIADAGDRYLAAPFSHVGPPRLGEVVAFRIGGGPASHAGVVTAAPLLDPARVTHVCERRGVVETRTPWHIARRWRFPLAPGCQPGRPGLSPGDLLAIVAETEEGAIVAIQGALDATPLSRSRPYPTAEAALAAVPAAIPNVERV